MAAGGNEARGSRGGDRTSADRITADAALVARLERAGFVGPEYEAVQRRLAEYGFVVVLGRLATGEIFRLCREAGRPLFPRADELHLLSTSFDDRATLAADTAMGGLDLFCRRGLVEGGWRSDGGAALDTYFVGACVRQFPQYFRTWRRRRDDGADCRGYGVDPEAEPALVARHATGLGPVEFVELVEELLEMPEDIRHAAVQMVFHGRSHAEIADDLGISAAALGERLRRYRAKHHPRRRREVR